MKIAPDRSVVPRLVVERDLDGVLNELEPLPCRYDTPGLQKHHGPHKEIERCPARRGDRPQHHYPMRGALPTSLRVHVTVVADEGVQGLCMMKPVSCPWARLMLFASLGDRLRPKCTRYY